ncbi:LysR family transcriptional regulator [Marinomonas sp. 15G1-11]|uniref:LysR family transcriptional regulator n=1 Tax=Marinomonas phaeophyticola TaxID=3004091 RepID=A0ABT4JP05_9GAMM|nr:LysR family transcriptional regulator [Marinomonas sp. 15G1-11]MCZ2720102.1 LysR family transcriptional regulator [Marinomonas sp. 15G1-11]
MLRNTNLNLLRSLHILLEECHVTKAAARLHISQSAVSRQLAQLRDLCQDPLLVRNGNQLIPTAKAVMLKTRLDSLLGEFDELLTDVPFEPKGYQGEIVFASSDYVAQYLFPDIAQYLTQQSPKLDISFQLWKPDLINMLHESGIHLASSMLTQKPDNVSSIYLGSDIPVCVMASHHTLAEQDQITVQDIVKYTHIKVTGGADKDSSVDRQLADKGYSRRITLKVPFFSTAMNLLTNSDRLIILPEHIAMNLARHWDIKTHVLPFETQEQKYWLFWHPKFDNEPAHKYFRYEIARILSTSKYGV